MRDDYLQKTKTSPLAKQQKSPNFTGQIRPKSRSSTEPTDHQESARNVGQCYIGVKRRVYDAGTRAVSYGPPLKGSTRYLTSKRRPIQSHPYKVITKVSMLRPSGSVLLHVSVSPWFFFPPVPRPPAPRTPRRCRSRPPPLRTHPIFTDGLCMRVRWDMSGALRG